jgi:UDP-glucose 4-epimerase
MFSGKTLLITCGTGSFGNAVLKLFLETNIKEIRIFSVATLKQVPSCEFFPLEAVLTNVIGIRQTRAIQYFQLYNPEIHSAA